MYQPQTPAALFILNQWTCHNCSTSLHTKFEHERGGTIVRCIACGAKNIVAATYQIIGWKD